MKAILNWRYYILFIIGMVATIGIFGVPDDNLPPMKWTANLLVSKGIGALAGYAFYKLIAYWEVRNLIPEWTKMYQDMEDEL